MFTRMHAHTRIMIHARTFSYHTTYWRTVYSQLILTVLFVRYMSLTVHVTLPHSFYSLYLSRHWHTIFLKFARPLFPSTSTTRVAGQQENSTSQCLSERLMDTECCPQQSLKMCFAYYVHSMAHRRLSRFNVRFYPTGKSITQGNAERNAVYKFGCCVSTISRFFNLVYMFWMFVPHRKSKLQNTICECLITNYSILLWIDNFTSLLFYRNVEIFLNNLIWLNHLLNHLA